jgi:hypothetical protein
LIGRLVELLTQTPEALLPTVCSCARS